MWCEKCHSGSEHARGNCSQAASHGRMTLHKRPFPDQPAWFGKSRKERAAIREATRNALVEGEAQAQLASA